MSFPRRSELVAWHRWRLHWLDPNQLTCLEQPGQLEETITPLETPGGKKAVIVPTSPSTAYVIEDRQPIGWDSDICHAGVLVYTVDSQLSNAQGAIRVKPAQGIYFATFGVGSGEVSTYEDGAIELEVLKTDGKSFRVRVTKK